MRPCCGNRAIYDGTGRGGRGRRVQASTGRDVYVNTGDWAAAMGAGGVFDQAADMLVSCLCAHACNATFGYFNHASNQWYTRILESDYRPQRVFPHSSIVRKANIKNPPPPKPSFPLHSSSIQDTTAVPAPPSPQLQPPTSSTPSRPSGPHDPRTPFPSPPRPSHTVPTLPSSHTTPSRPSPPPPQLSSARVRHVPRHKP